MTTKNHVVLCAVVVGALASAACDGLLDAAVPESPEAVDPSVAVADNQDAHYDPDDLAYDETDVVQILLEGATASSDSNDVVIDGADVTIEAAGVYALSGTLDDGSVVVDVDDEDDVVLILNGVDITNTDGAALAVLSADEASILLADGTLNQLMDGSAYVFPDAETDEPNATLYAADDLTIAGTGELDVTANFNDGIASKDGLVIASGTIRVAATDDGIRGKDYVVVEDGDLTIDAGGDGIKSDNEEDAERGYVQVNGGVVDIVAGDDGIQAATDALIMGGDVVIDAGDATDTGRGILGAVMVVVTDGTVDATAIDDAIHSNDEVLISGGVLTLASGDDGVHADHLVTIDGGSVTITDAFEGIEGETIVINDGFIDITSNDDGLNVASAETSSSTNTNPGPGGGGPGEEVVGDYTVYINGGTTLITITDRLDEQGDGIDANGHVQMTGGVVVVSGPTDTRNSAVDYGTFTVSGGLFIGTHVDGRNSQAVGSGSTQPSLYATLGSRASAGSVVHIASPEGDGLVTFKPANAYDVVVFSSPDLVEGESYNIYVGGSAAGDSTTRLYDDVDDEGELGVSVTAGF